MIVCSRCGFQNEDSDTFCGSCASFLEWEGQKVKAEAPAPEPEPEPEPEAESRQGIIERVKEVIGLGDDSNAAAANGHTGAVDDAPVEEAPAEEAEPEVATPGAVSAPVVGGGLSGMAGQTLAPAGAPAAPTGSVTSTVTASPEPSAPMAAPPAPSVPAAASVPASALSSSTTIEADRPAVTTETPVAAPSAPEPAAPQTIGAEMKTSPEAPAASPPVAAPPAPAVSSPPAAASPPSTPPATPPAAGGLTSPGAPQRTTSAVAPGAPVRPQPTPAGSGAQANGGAGPAGPGPVAPAAVQPQAVKPTAVKNRPAPKKAAPVREINPGDKICGQCGEGNDPVRKFCRRCGASLVEATVYKLPWYRALWRRMTTRQHKQAGARPKLRRRMFGGSGGWLSSWLLRLIVLAIIVLVVLSFVGPVHKSWRKTEKRYYHNVINLVHPTYHEFFARNASASTAAAGHPALFAVDGEKNTSWQSNGKTTGQSLVVTFPQTADIAKVGFDIGDQDTPQSFQTEPRPEKVQIVFQGQKPVTKTLTLNDAPGFQTFNVTAKGSTGFTMNIESVYAATGTGQNVSIAELEFFTKS